MGIVSFGSSNQQSPIPAINQFQLTTNNYTWNTGFGYQLLQDRLEFPVFAVITKINCNFPIRLRLYQSTEARLSDLNRPPYIMVNEPKIKIFLDAILGGTNTSNQLTLSPVCLIAGVTQYPVTLEKLLPDAATINLLIELVR